MAGPWRKEETWLMGGPESAFAGEGEPARPERLLRGPEMPRWEVEHSPQGYVVVLVGLDDFYERIELGPQSYVGGAGWETEELARNAAAVVLRRLANAIEGVES